ncbi:hypothetical protein ABB37_08539 [Leptomonas pyrrhocoris]|uniref:Uncharacterized protein n=1 Tax=Leptomonas pyrrhocoris TaxID=157538 RepID=A0A0N0VDI7_LEPPY|nr:hypothetical protein ABB37_08539 [Leptomonas pyrrhocoris]XP_015653664.1 hypothetical protein ABB37_08539 [Leptomonas pyrrhocoris]KPA75224.1 hypothetical protein ABB37_08539 [Leptomonas pyrrhocoris]KPA75225.1 hypothetical protein ABB37_08539 [Leptomonas pyrrhocoris]|eukprot:XP_015653663.1 hypothetical protein ABB37_08539 [Leptomonas pyrrhocoris]
MTSPPSSKPFSAPQQLARSAGGAASCGASRKSTRRGDGEEHPSSAPHLASTTALQPPPPFGGRVDADNVAPTSSVQTVAGGGGGWEASLSPSRGYTATCRGAGQGALQREAPTHSHGNAAPSTEPHLSHSSSSLPQQQSPPPPPRADLHRLKRRRTEQASFTSLYKEICMYLDAVAATQQAHQMEAAHAQEGAEEDAPAEREQVRDSSISSSSYGAAAHGYSASAPPPPSSSAFTFVSASGPLNTGASYTTAFDDIGGATATSPTTAPPMTVDAAVEDTLRVLRTCWEYRGAPHDAFEPVRLLSPITVHLLTTYGHHTVTRSGEYVVLRGGAEQLPWVGCLYGILQSYVYRGRQQLQQQGHRLHSGGIGGPAETTTSGITTTADPVLTGEHNTYSSSISRVLLLNCHSFGWLDHVGSDEYERSHRRLYQAREALVSLLEDVRYATLGWRASCPLCSSSTVGGDASTSVLLGDTIVMEGGAPSLGLASSRNTFTAHYQYGRGIACCVPEQRPPALLKTRGQTCDVVGGNHSSSNNSVGGGGQREGAAQFGLCAMHQMALEEVRRHSSPRWPAPPAPNTYQAVEEAVPRRNGSNGGGGVHRSHPSPPTPLSAYDPLSSPTLDVSHLPAVSCGTCRAAGVLGQAVLMGPTGPLVIHLQFEEREWLEAAAPLMGLMGGEVMARPVPHGGWTLTETTAVCPAPLVNTAALRTDPAGALAAVLYAQMQGHGTAGLARTPHSAYAAGGGRSSGSGLSSSPPPLTAIPGGGAVSLPEFVEWLVGLLHTPPPALVVEWHSSSSISVSSCCSPTTGTQPLQMRYSSADSSLYPEYANTTQMAAPNTQASSASSAELPHPCPPPHLVHSDGSSNNHNSGNFPPSPPSVPLGMSVRPRHPAVPQLLETYADVVRSHPPTDTAGLSAAAAAASFPLSTAAPHATTSTFGTHYNLQSMLTSASLQAAEKDQVLLEWVQAAQNALRPCEATAYFDSVDRPLVLAKGLEVVMEGERYVNANSVATSLQFRPRLAGLRDHYAAAE